MHPEFAPLCIALLLVALAMGGYIAFLIARIKGSALNISTILIANYLLIYQVSGIVHFLGRTDRGYFDLLSRSVDEQLYVTGMSCLGLAALCWGCWPQKRERPVDLAKYSVFWLGGDVKIAAIWIMAIIFPPSLYAASTMQQYVSDTGAVRVISVEGGLARYAFMSHWLVWVISLLVLLVVGSRSRAGTAKTLLVLSLGVIGIAAALSWTGGRSIVMLMTFPLILTIIPRIHNARIPALVVGALCFLVYLTVISQVRASSYRFVQEVSYASMVDWQWGRFSMLGFALQYTDTDGLLWGRTFLDGILLTLRGLAQLAMIKLPDWQIISATSIATKTLTHSAVSFIVPGVGAEAYINFGLLGLMILLFAIGRIARWIDRQIALSENVLQRFSYAFIGAVLIFRGIALDLSGSYQFLIYSGAPVMVCLAFARSLDRGKRKQRSAQASTHCTPRIGQGL